MLTSIDISLIGLKWRRSESTIPKRFTVPMVFKTTLDYHASYSSKMFERACGVEPLFMVGKTMRSTVKLKAAKAVRFGAMATSRPSSVSIFLGLTFQG